MTPAADSNPNQLSRWRRDTPWKQGSVVPAEAAESLSIDPKPSGSTALLVVVSHDCDLAEDDLEAEPFIELMWTEIISKAQADYTNAKSPSTLDLEIGFEGGIRAVRFNARRKLTVQKIELSSVGPDQRFGLDEKARGILQSWLAARYRRAALPDALHSHLSAIRKTLQELGNKSPHAIIGFYINHDPDEELANPEEPYELWITVVFDHSIDGAEQTANEAAQKITARLERKFKTDSGWRSIDLRSCVAISDRKFSLYDSQTLKLYRLEHISLKHSARAAD